MEIGGSIAGVKGTKLALKAYSEDLGRDFVSLLTQEARSLCVELGRHTFPLGLKDGDNQRLQERIKGEIMRLFPAHGDGKAGAVRIYGLLEKSSPKAGNAYWKAYKEGDEQAQEGVLNKRVQGLPRKIDRGKHKVLRTAKRGRVAKKASAVAVVRKTARDNYIKRVQKRAGMAKAGWLSAAKSLSGRVRSGGGRSGGTRETFPAWVRKAGARRKLGGASVRKRGNGALRIELRNTVRHADEALLLSLQQRAEFASVRNFNRAMEQAVKFRRGKVRRRLAA